MFDRDEDYEQRIATLERELAAARRDATNVIHDVGAELLRVRAQLEKTDAEATRLAGLASIEQRRAEAAEVRLAAAVSVVEQLDSDVRNARASREPKGMHVPWHGPFASAVPSVLKDLDRLSKDLRAALTAQTEIRPLPPAFIKAAVSRAEAMRNAPAEPRNELEAMVLERAAPAEPNRGGFCD